MDRLKKPVDFILQCHMLILNTIMLAKYGISCKTILYVQHSGNPECLPSLTSGTESYPENKNQNAKRKENAYA